MSLFTSFEERPRRCQAVYVGFDNIDAVARYYAESGYDTDVSRHDGQVLLTLEKEGHTVAVAPGQALRYGHPPEVLDYEQFSRDWRPEAKYEPKTGAP